MVKLTRLLPVLSRSPKTPTWILAGDGTPATLDIDFVNDRAWNSGTASIASLLTCTRASTGYYTKADGTLQSFSSNVLRYGTNGLLVEAGATNVSQYSQLLSAATSSSYWAGPTQGSVTSTTATAPDGTGTAYLVAENSANAVHYVVQDQGIARTAVAYCLSAYVKTNGRHAQLSLIEPVVFNHHGIRVDLSNGTITGTTGTVTSSGVETLANGWYRIWIVKTLSTGDWFIRLGMADSDGAIPKSYAGDGTSGMYVWGVQLETGTFPTSYIPTTSSSATRAADDISLADFSVVNQSAQTVYADFQVNQAYTGGDPFVAWEISAANRADCSANAAVNFDNQISCQATGAAFATLAALDMAGEETARIKAAFALATDNFAASRDGGAASTDVSGTWPAATLTRLQLGGYTGSIGGALNGRINRLALWNTRLADAALQTLTA